MHVAVNGKAIVDGRLVLPLAREWSATLDVNATEAINGAATISIADGELQFVGTARSEIVNGRCKMKLMAGAGGITGAIAGKSYYRISARNLIADILAEIGETLGPVSGLDVELVHWMRASGPASRELRVLFASLGLGWRMNPSGTLWCGVESWPETAMKKETILREDPASGEYEIAANVPNIFPGETWDGRRVRTVTHTIAGSTLRTTLSTATQ
jgi:hypothetical protein